MSHRVLHAYGDLIAAALALSCIVALRSNLRLATPLVWVTNAWGFVDLLNGVRGILHAVGTRSTEGQHRLCLAGGRQVVCRTIVIATGARYRRLSVQG